METYGGNSASASAIVSDGFSEHLSFPTSSSSPASTVKQEIRRRVLIVDDHASVRALIRIVLEEHQELEIAGEAMDGEEAVAMAEVHRPDVVLMDIHMPRLNGVEATRRISRALPGTAIIGLSLEYSPYAYNAMCAAGAVAFLRKEDVMDSLYKTIQFSLQARPNRQH